MIYMGIFVSSMIIDLKRFNVNVIGLIKCDEESSFEIKSFQNSSKKSQLKKFQNHWYIRWLR